MKDETKVATLESVREMDDGLPAEIWLKDGKLVLRAYNECGYSYTELYLLDLLDAVRGQQRRGCLVHDLTEALMPQSK